MLLRCQSTLPDHSSLKVSPTKVLSTQCFFDHTDINLLTYILRYTATDNKPMDLTDVPNVCTEDRAGINVEVSMYLPGMLL